MLTQFTSFLGKAATINNDTLHGTEMSISDIILTVVLLTLLVVVFFLSVRSEMKSSKQ